MNDHPEGWKPQLGLLPAIPGRPTLQLRSLAAEPVALPVPPPEIHNIERVPDRDMLGNDKWGDCVFAAIENNRRIAAATLGATITRLTAAQVVANYKSHTGATTPPGPGAVIQKALKWAHDHGWGGSKLLCYATLPRTELAIREAVNEFQSCLFGVVIKAAQEYPAKVWADVGGKTVGGHGVAGGTETVGYDFAKTWGYMVEMTPNFMHVQCNEVSVLVWDFQWASLTYDRQVSLVADYQALTGKTWTGPAPIAPPPVPPTPPTPTPPAPTPPPARKTFTVTTQKTIHDVALAVHGNPRLLLRWNQGRYGLSDAANSSLYQAVQPGWVLFITA